MRFGSPNASTLQRDLIRLLQDTGDLLGSMARDEPKLKEAMKLIDSGLNKAQTTAAGAIDYSKNVVRGADEYVHESPWQSVGGALAVGVVLGMLICRR